MWYVCGNDRLPDAMNAIGGGLTLVSRSKKGKAGKEKRVEREWRQLDGKVK